MALSDKLRGRSPGDLRDEREALGFVRRPAVRWLSPGLLARAGVEALVSATFGKLADKRELQDAVQAGLDYADGGELWVDYISDTGDGFDATYTIAWLLAQDGLDFDGEKLPRGRVLLLGGDQVYPTADPEAYEDRMVGPFAAALPAAPADGPQPHLYALPGNHDWYDGLTSFLRVFCARGGNVGGWLTRQRRSYFALRLAHGWWIWAIDIQLDTYIDDVQLDYFRSQPLERGDKVVLLTAKPAWVKAVPGRVEPASWRYLSYFEQRVVRASGAHLALTLTGDLHHYCRYEPDDPAEPTRLTAGGGGAYLSATHTLPDELSLRSLDSAPGEGVRYRRAAVYPRADVSSRLARGILALGARNPTFAALMAATYALVGIALLATLDGATAGLGAAAAAGGFGDFLHAATGAPSVIAALALLGAIYPGTDVVARPLQPSRAVERLTSLARLAVALAQTAAHVLLAAAVLWAAAELVGGAAVAIWLAGLAALALAGAVGGTTIFAVFLLAVHRVRGGRAWATANTVFTGQAIADHKHLLRMRFADDGSLTVHALGVDRVGRAWEHVGADGGGPAFRPRAGAPVARPVDVPLRFDAAGRRAR